LAATKKYGFGLWRLEVALIGVKKSRLCKVFADLD
jgi:hypothetical protein